MNAITQPTGLKAFGWGVLGFFGANLVGNIVARIGAAIGEAGNANDFWYVVVTFAGIGAAYYFAKTREYEATRTGGYVSVGWQILICIVLIGAVL